MTLTGLWAGELSDPTDALEIRKAAGYFFNDCNGHWPPIRFALQGYFLKGDAIVMGLMPESETDFMNCQYLLRGIEAVRMDVFDVDIPILAPDIFHITTAYCVGEVKSIDTVRGRVIAMNGELDSILDGVGRTITVTRFIYSEFGRLSDFPRVPGFLDLSARSL